MSAIDFATVKPGDIILSINPHDLQGDPLGSLAHAYTKYIVVSANGTDSIVAANAWRASGSELELLTKNGEGVTFKSLDGHLEPGRRPSEAILHFTEEEYISKSMATRIWAQSKLASFMSSWYRSEVAFPKEVTKAMQKALAEKAGDNLSNMNMGNLESAYNVMGEVLAAGEKVYRDTIEANLSGMNELIQHAQEANEQVNQVARNLTPWRNDGEATTITHQDSQGYYRTVDLHNTFRTGTGVMTGSGDAYFIERVTKSRAYVTNPQTGEQAGYLTRQKRAGVVLKLNNGEEVTLGQTYTVIPANTPEDLLAYKAAYDTARTILEALEDHIKAARPHLTGFNLEMPSLSVMQTLPNAQATAAMIHTTLKREKLKVLDGMEANIHKMKRLHQLAYSN